MTLHPKVAAGAAGAISGTALGSQLTGLLIWILTAHGVAVPSEQIPNIEGIVSTLLSGALAVLGGWVTPSPNPTSAPQAQEVPR